MNIEMHYSGKFIKFECVQPQEWKMPKTGKWACAF